MCQQNWSRIRVLSRCLSGLLPLLSSAALLGTSAWAFAQNPFPAQSVHPASQQLGDAPRLHVPPVTPFGSSVWMRLLPGWDSHSRQTQPRAQPHQAASGPPADATPSPSLPDETEATIRDIRQRVGGVGDSFSDLLSPAESQRLFAEALSRVRQEQAANPPPSPPNSTTLTDRRNSEPRGPIPPVYSPVPPPPSAVNHAPSPHLVNPNMVNPNMVLRGQEFWAPGSAGDPQSRGASPGWEQPGGRFQPPAAYPQANGPRTPLPPMLAAESEQSAVRRIARQIDQLAEELESLQRYAEADSLRRYAQELRTAVR